MKGAMKIRHKSISTLRHKCCSTVNEVPPPVAAAFTSFRDGISRVQQLSINFKILSNPASHLILNYVVVTLQVVVIAGFHII